jgi:ADP-ribose pyrophosphatase YjhB (NUDIX family)
MKQRVVMAFVTQGAGEVLLVRRKRTVAPYPDRLATAAGPLAPGERPEDAARRAVQAELGLAVEAMRVGLAVEFTDTLRKRNVTFRVYPVLCRPLAPPQVEDGIWMTPDEVIVRAALGETVPELDEALARVWDPPEALPPVFREEARAIHRDATTSSAELGGRAAAMVVAGAPPERVAALRPGRARIVNAARAATRSGRDVPGELLRAQSALERVVDGERRRTGGSVEIVHAEALTRGGVAVCPVGTGGRGPLWVAVDSWAEWEDDVPPPLEEGWELVPPEKIERVVALPS